MTEAEPSFCCGKLSLRKGCFCIGIFTSIVYFVGFCYDLYWVVSVSRTPFSYFFISAVLIGELLNIAAGPILSIGARKYNKGMLTMWISAGLLNVKINIFREIFTLQTVLRTSACTVTGKCDYVWWFLPLKVAELLMILALLILHLFCMFHVYKLWKDIRDNKSNVPKKLEENTNIKEEQI